MKEFNITIANQTIAAEARNTEEAITIATEARAKLFSIYPEIGTAYNTICGGNPAITFDGKWITLEMGKKLAGFINLIKYLEVDEIFPNFESIKEAAAITDGGTIGKDLAEVVEYLGKIAGKLACDRGNDINLARDYRYMAQWVIARNKVDILNDKDCGVIQSCCKFCGIDYKMLTDAIKVEVSISSYLFN